MTFQAGENVWVEPNSTRVGEPGYHGTVTAVHTTTSGRFVFSIQPHDKPDVLRIANLHSLRGVTTQE